MAGDKDLTEMFRRNVLGAGTQGAFATPPPAATDAEEPTCRAFGFLRGVQDRALAVELRYRTGNSDCFEYSCLLSWRYNPSVGLLLKFSGGDTTVLVLIRGSNLDLPVEPGPVKLAEGLQRHRIVWVREMDEDELRLARNGEPTIDRIEVGDFESAEEQRKWLQKVAPVFLR